MAAARTRNPPLALRALFAGSLALSALPLAFGFHSAREWWAERAGRPIEDQRASLLGVPWLKPAYARLVRRLALTLPPGARLYVEPDRGTLVPSAVSGDERWQLFLSYDLYPIEVLVRAPALASGTLVEYPRWLERALLDEDRAEVERELVERGVEWRLRYPLAPGIDARDVALERKVDGAWIAWELAPLGGAAGGWPKARRPPD